MLDELITHYSLLIKKATPGKERLRLFKRLPPTKLLPC